MTEKEAVKQLGEQIGYGNMMHLASELWKEDMIANGYPVSGVFVPALPCDVNRPPLSYVCGECSYFKPHHIYNPDAFDGTVPGNCMMLQVPHTRHNHDPACCQCVPINSIPYKLSLYNLSDLTFKGSLSKESPIPAFPAKRGEIYVIHPELLGSNEIINGLYWNTILNTKQDPTFSVEYDALFLLCHTDDATGDPDLWNFIIKIADLKK